VTVSSKGHKGVHVYFIMSHSADLEIWVRGHWRSLEPTQIATPPVASY